MNYVCYRHKYISFYCKFHEEQSHLPITEWQKTDPLLQEGSISYRYLKFRSFGLYTYSGYVQVPLKMGFAALKFYVN
jgi:hypothetical protein